MIPQNGYPGDPEYHDPQNVSTPNRAYPKGYGSRDMPSRTATAYFFGAILLLAGALWAFSPKHTVTATNPLFTTTGQGGSASAPSMAPNKPREKSGGDNNVLDVDLPPKK
jgi:hypothetical protein